MRDPYNLNYADRLTRGLLAKAREENLSLSEIDKLVGWETGRAEAVLVTHPRQRTDSETGAIAKAIDADLPCVVRCAWRDAAHHPAGVGADPRPVTSSDHKLAEATRATLESESPNDEDDAAVGTATAPAPRPQS